MKLWGHRAERAGARQSRAGRAFLQNTEELTGPIRVQLALIGLVSAFDGVLEAFLLFIIAHVAASLTSTPSALASFGPLDLGGFSTTGLVWLGFAMVPVVLAVQVVSGWQIARVYASSIHNARSRLIESHADANWPAKEKMTGATLVQIAHANVSRTGDAVMAAGSLVAAGANFIALLASAVVIDPLAALAITGGVAALLGLVLPLAQMARRLQARLVGMNRAYAAGLYEYAAIGREIEIFGVQRNSTAAILAVSRRLRRATQRARMVSSVSSAIFKSAALFLVLALLAVVTWSGTGNFGALAATALILLRSVSYGQAVQTNLHSLMEGSAWVADLRRNVDELEASTVGVRVDPAPAPLRGEPVALALQNLTFGYSEGARVLTDLSLEIQAGGYVGIAGVSGAGKSTLAELLLALRRPSSGKVLVDGVDLARIPPELWSRRIAFVPQEPVLTSGSLRDNVRFYRDYITDDQIDWALAAANVLTDARGWEDGIDTQVGSLGGRLSGGQKQRIAIARALVDEPSLLVLDEPTSALDELSEAKIAATLATVRGRMTIVVIAHRLSTLRRCDRVIVLADGGLAAFGPPEVLGNLSGYLEQGA